MKLIKKYALDALFILAGLSAAVYINDRAFLRGYIQGVTDLVHVLDNKPAHERAPLPDAPAVFVRPRKGQDI
jgi:hypothetical protein